jgi:hypothetical protein
MAGAYPQLFNCGSGYFKRSFIRMKLDSKLMLSVIYGTLLKFDA